MKAEEKQNIDRSWIAPFLATLFGMMTLQMSSLGFAPLLPAIQKEFSMSYTEIGLFTGMYGLLALALSLPAGLAAKRYGEKRILVLALLLVAFGLFMLGKAPGFYTAFASRALWIGAYRFAFVGVLTAIAVTAPPSLKGASMGFLGSVAPLASVIGAPFGSAIGEDFGWRTGMTAYACAAILGAGICGYMGPQMLGVLRDWTKGFSAGWYMMAGIALLTLIELLLLKRYAEINQAKRADAI